MNIEISPDMTVETGVPSDTPPPPIMPLRFWIAVDTGLMTLEKAQAAWVIAQAKGEKYDPLG